MTDIPGGLACSGQRARDIGHTEDDGICPGPIFDQHAHYRPSVEGTDGKGREELDECQCKQYGLERQGDCPAGQLLAT